MKVFKSIYLRLNGKPFGTEELVSKNKFILRKRQKGNFEDTEEYKQYIKQIKMYGNIVDPVIVSREAFSPKYVIRGNHIGYYALKNSHMANIPVAIIN